MSSYERKYSEDGSKVAVLYSPGFGAGWSTWARQHKEQMLFDKRFVEAAIAGIKDIEPMTKEIFGEDHPYLGVGVKFNSCGCLLVRSSSLKNTMGLSPSRNSLSCPTTLLGKRIVDKH